MNYTCSKVQAEIFMGHQLTTEDLKREKHIHHIQFSSDLGHCTIFAICNFLQHH